MENASVQYKSKICPRCGKTFACYGDNDCWCEKVRLHRRELVIIMQNYNDCLCPDCLNKFSGE